MGEVLYNNRFVKADTFPMGVDYNKYNSAIKSKKVEQQRLKLAENILSKKVILSIDRQDYSKGILNRLKGYEYFFGKFSQMVGEGGTYYGSGAKQNWSGKLLRLLKASLMKWLAE